jgi:hypothetical protein
MDGWLLVGWSIGWENLVDHAPYETKFKRQEECHRMPRCCDEVSGSDVGDGTCLIWCCPEGAEWPFFTPPFSPIFLVPRKRHWPSHPSEVAQGSSIEAKSIWGRRFSRPSGGPLRKTSLIQSHPSLAHSRRSPH